MNVYLAKCLFWLVCWKLAWSVIYRVFGLYVGYITINNGISLNNVEFRRGAVVKASSVRLRLWGNTRKLVVSDLIITKSSNSPTRSPAHAPEDISDTPVSVYSGSKTVRYLVQFLISIWKHLDIEIKNARIDQEEFFVGFKSVQILFYSQHSLHDSNHFDVRFSVSMLKTKIGLQKFDPQTDLINADSSSISASLIIERRSGIISNVVTKVFVDEAEVSLSPIFKKVMMKLERESVDNAVHENEQNSGDIKIIQFKKIYKNISSCFKECSVNAVSFSARGIPLVTPSKDCTLPEYLSMENAGNTLYVSVDTASLHLERLTTKSAGFDIHFDSVNDHPVHVTFSSSSVKMGFEPAYALRGGVSSPLSKNEFFSFPNFGFTFKTNAARKLVDGSGFENSMMEVFSSGNSPLLDVDHLQLADLEYNFNLWKKLFLLHRLRKPGPSLTNRDTSTSSDSSDEDTWDDTRSAKNGELRSVHTEQSSVQNTRTSDFLSKALDLLKDHFLHLNVKVTVEQPRVLLRVKKVESEKTQMVMLSYSLMVMHISTKKYMEYDAECQFLHPSITFSEKFDSDSAKDTLNEEICGTSDARFCLKVSKDLTVEIRTRVNGVFLALTKPDVLNGLHDVINEASYAIARNGNSRSVSSRLDNELVKLASVDSSTISDQRQNTSRDLHSVIFQSWPSWFASFDLQVSDIDLRIGSVSPLLPLEYISKLSHSQGKRFKETESTLNLNMKSLTILSGNAFREQEKALASSASSSHASSSSETLASNFSIDSYWSVSTMIENLKLNFINELKHSSICSIPCMSIELSANSQNNEDQLFHDLSIDAINVSLDRSKLFAIFGSVFLLNETIVTPLKSFHARLMDNKLSHKSSSQAKHSVCVSDFLRINATVEKIDIVVVLSNEFKLRLQNYTLHVSVARGVLTSQSKFLRAMVLSSSLEHHWDRVLCVDSMTFKYGDPAEIQSIVLHAKFLRFIQPHGFVVYKLFDNLSVFLKIAKHLAKCVRYQERETLISPRESCPLVPTAIKLIATRLSFIIEDDPFDGELNMIYQLGLIEQRKRIELANLLDENLKNEDLCQDDRDSRLISLHKFFEASWVRKVKTYKAELRKDISQNKQFLYGSEMEIPELEYDRLRPYCLHAPLLSVILEGMTILISQPEFPLEKLSDFVFEYGQGVPRDTRYNLMIPTHLNLSVEELRMHLRDYPLPLFYLPYATNHGDHGRALSMKGHLIICESLVLDKEHLRALKVQLTDATNKISLQPNAFDKLTIEKSLSTVKLFTDMEILFDSNSPSRFVWGQSYQFGIQQIMLTIDQFSKPPVDPSPKLGFWDKLRLVLHGKVCIKTGRATSIEVAFKSGKDPYDLFNESNGFILSFEDSVVWEVNQHDDPSSFFNIRAEKLSWYIPSYLSQPLLCWTRESYKATYLPASEKFITSCFGIYLNDSTTGDLVQNSDCCEKMVMQLKGGVQFSVGFHLERFSAAKNQLTSDGKKHYEIELFNPEFTNEFHDSYKGFRADRLHMAISLQANTNKSNNSIHLSPGVFKQFFSWWGMFQGNLILPVRKGKLFQETKGSQKFSEHLFSNKFLFDIGNLFISHIFREGDKESQKTKSHYSCVGLRAKVKEFSVDLHQNKEEIINVHEQLSRRKKVMKMRFNIGQVLLNEIDLRTVSATFRYSAQHSQSLESDSSALNFLKTLDQDHEWFNPSDFVECYRFSDGLAKAATVTPLLYSETFAYSRRAEEEQNSADILESEMHKCVLKQARHNASEVKIYKERMQELIDLSCSMMDRSNFLESRRKQVLDSLIESCDHNEESSNASGSVASLRPRKRDSFQNKFLLVSMFLKWNEAVRNDFLKYIHYVSLTSSHKKFLSYAAMISLEKLMGKQDSSNDDSLISSITESAIQDRGDQENIDISQNCHFRFENLDRIIREVEGHEKIMEDYQVEVVSPQIQLHSEELSDSVVIITAPSLESKIFSVVANEDEQSNSRADILERRFGVILHDASVLVVDEHDVVANPLAFETIPYGTATKWPPFLGVETCKKHELASKENVLVEQMSLSLSFSQNFSSSSSQGEKELSSNAPSNRSISEQSGANADKLRVDIPQISINCTSKQYFSLYATILSLMLYMEPLAAELREKMRKLNFSIDFQDFRALRHKLQELHENVAVTNELLKNYSFRHESHQENNSSNDFSLLARKKAMLETEIVMMQQTLYSGDVSTDSLTHIVQDWQIAADTVTLHMLNDDRSNILELNIDRGVYKRVLKDDGSNDNRIEIMSIDGRTLVPSSHFRKFLEPISPPGESNLLTIDWSMNRSVGGIKIIENFDISSLPLNVRIDEETGRSLMKFLFRQTEGQDLSDSPTLKIAERAQIHTNRPSTQPSDDGRLSQEDETQTKGSSLKDGKKKSPSATTPELTESTISHEKDVSLMISRSKKYLSIAQLTSHSFEVMISLRMKKGWKKWLNVTNFLLEIPFWEIRTRVLSLSELVDYFKAIVTRALMSHSGRLLKNKVTKRSKNLQRSCGHLENARSRTSGASS